jgi:hypothetical protein
MPKTRRLLAPLLVLLASACSTVSVNQDYAPDVDFRAYRSFDWFPGHREVAGEGGVSDPFLEERIRNAVTRELAAKGLRKVSGGSPDFWVNYHVSVQQKLTSSGVNVGYGVGSYGSWGGVGIGMGTNPVRQYEEGTLMIDFIDGRSRKLVWRGTGSKALSRNPTPEDTTRTVDLTTHEILKQFPPGQE